MRTALRADVARHLTPRMSQRPIDARGYPVPWFVEWIDGKPDFRVADRRKFSLAVRFRLCWICGEKVGNKLTFVLGPMCTVSRTTSEPGSHLECARFAVKTCPFMLNPSAHYRDAKRPENWTTTGEAQFHNPGASVLWTARKFRHWQAPDGGYLLTVGEPDAVEFWTRGRLATRAEALAALEIGLTKLCAIAETDGPAAIAELERRHKLALTYFPKDPDA